jgi:hypothetical protein
MANEQPFQITIAEEELSLLKRKLDDTRFPDEVDGVDWAYGAPLADIRRLAERWRNGYDWRAHERELNTLPMFTRSLEVGGFGELKVHYVHQRSSVRGAIPLLFVHGCKFPFHPSLLSSHIVYWARSTRPGSFLEATKALPLLTAASPDHPSFHVVAPSLPGFAWSEGVRKKGSHAKHYAEVWLTRFSDCMYVLTATAHSSSTN